MNAIKGLSASDFDSAWRFKSYYCYWLSMRYSLGGWGVIVWWCQKYHFPPRTRHCQATLETQVWPNCKGTKKKELCKCMRSWAFALFFNHNTPGGFGLLRSIGKGWGALGHYYITGCNRYSTTPCFCSFLHIMNSYHPRPSDSLSSKQIWALSLLTTKRMVFTIPTRHLLQPTYTDQVGSGSCEY